MDTKAKEIMELLEMMAIDPNTIATAKHYFEGLGKDASMKERTNRFIELLIRDGLAMGFEPGDDVGDIVWCMDDIAEHYHLLISANWFSEEDDMTGWLRTLGEHWGRNGVRILYIEDPRGRIHPIYAAPEEAAPAILKKAAETGIAMYGVEELSETEEEDNEAIDWSLG